LLPKTLSLSCLLVYQLHFKPIDVEDGNTMLSLLWFSFPQLSGPARDRFCEGYISFCCQSSRGRPLFFFWFLIIRKSRDHQSRHNSYRVITSYAHPDFLPKVRRLTHSSKMPDVYWSVSGYRTQIQSGLSTDPIQA